MYVCLDVCMYVVCCRLPACLSACMYYNLQESLLPRGPVQHDLDAGTRTHAHAYMHTQHVRKPAWLPRGILTALSGFPNANNNLFYGITLVTALITCPARTRCYDRGHTRPGWQGSRFGRHCVITAPVAYLHRFSRAHTVHTPTHSMPALDVLSRVTPHGTSSSKGRGVATL